MHTICIFIDLKCNLHRFDLWNKSRSPLPAAFASRGRLEI